MTSSAPLEAASTAGQLVVEDVRISYNRHGRVFEAVHGISFSVEPGEILGIVGESGSGKSSIAQAILRLLPSTAKLSGRIVLNGQNLVDLSESSMRSIRGDQIGMVFQDPAAALNPVFRVSTQIIDTLRRSQGKDARMSRKAALARAGEMVEEMGIPASRLNSFPHQLSGGMRQRILIAAAMAGNPGFLVADEPTSDLDTVSQAGILRQLRKLRDERNIGLILISHDMGVISSICDHVGVMRQGELVEIGSSADVLVRPSHPYTRGLVQVSRKELDSTGRFVTVPDFVDVTAVGAEHVEVEEEA